MSHDNTMRHEGLDRRRFMAGLSAATVAGGLAGLFPRSLAAAESSAGAEQAVRELYATLSDAQKQTICLPFKHKLRSRISPNWQITKPTLGEDFYSPAQRELAQRVVKSLCSEDGYQRLQKQVADDAGGLEDYSMALFGTPDSGQFHWELTGRHLTLRADGDRHDRLAFGGPVVYGHGEEEPENNLFFYQTQQVNKVFASLEGPQRPKALIEKSPREADVQLQGAAGQFRGIPVRDLSPDQKQLVVESLQVLLAPFRSEDVQEVMWILLENGGVDSLHMAFSQQGDLNNDKVWDVWRVEGPAFVWHFRGAPHVHAYINIGAAVSAG